MKNPLPNPRRYTFNPVFSSEFYPLFSLLIDLRLTFAYGVRRGFQVSQYLLLNELFFLLYVLSTFIKNELAIHTWIYYWAVKAIALKDVIILCQHHIVAKAVTFN